MNKIKTSLVIAAMALSTSAAADEWVYGIGTGLSSLDVDGIGAFDTKLLGPVEFDASMKPDDVREYTESAFGFGGFAQKGDWMITYALGRLELQEDVSVKQGGNTGTFDITFINVAAEVLANYTFSKSDNTAWGIIGGARYTSQEYEGDITINGAEVFDGSVDDNWTDAVIGLSHTYAFSPTTSWSTQVDTGVGGSEGTDHLNTAVNWIYSESWMFGFSLDIKTIEYQESDPGDSDYFLYDADETTVGGSFLYIF